MKLTVRSVLLALLLTASVLVLPASAQEARRYSWSSWTDRTFQVKTRYDEFFTPGTTSVWQFQRNHRHTGKRQVRVISADWYLDSDTFGPWTVGAWKPIGSGDTVTIKGSIVYPCQHRDGHGFKMIAQVRKKVHGVWSAPRDLTYNWGSGDLGC